MGQFLDATKRMAIDGFILWLQLKWWLWMGTFLPQLKELSTDDIVSLAATIRGYLTDEKIDWIYRECCFILKLI